MKQMCQCTKTFQVCIHVNTGGRKAVGGGACIYQQDTTLSLDNFWLMRPFIWGLATPGLSNAALWALSVRFVVGSVWTQQSSVSTVGGKNESFESILQIDSPNRPIFDFDDRSTVPQMVWVTRSNVTHVVVPTVTDGGRRIGAGRALEVHVVAGADLSRVQHSVAEP